MDAIQVERPDRQWTTDDEDDDMPPLLPAQPTPASSTALTTRPSSSSSSSSGSNALLHPCPARFAFRPDWQLCTANYACCLRYSLKLATCCMPRPSEFRFVPSFRWLQARFYPLDADADTLRFLRDCDDKFYRQGWVSWWGLRIGVLKPVLRRCMAHTDVNGMLGCGQMFLASSEQIRTLLQQSIPAAIRGQPGVEWPWSIPSSAAASSSPRPSRLLDVGAGDGHITSYTSRFFAHTTATEVAVQMIRRLKARGFETVLTGDLDEGLPLTDRQLVGDGFDCITLFNVLDRCSKPRTLLRQIRARLRKPDFATGVNSSRVILSVPLPLDPSVEVGTRWLDPAEQILVNSRQARDFEASICAVAEMLLSVGFDIESVSRIPYLSQGDTWRPFYVLDASLWVLSARYDGDPLPKQTPEGIDSIKQTTNDAAANGHAHGGPTASSMALEVD